MAAAMLDDRRRRSSASRRAPASVIEMTTCRRSVLHRARRDEVLVLQQAHGAGHGLVPHLFAPRQVRDGQGAGPLQVSEHRRLTGGHRVRRPCPPHEVTDRGTQLLRHRGEIQVIRH